MSSTWPHARSFCSKESPLATKTLNGGTLHGSYRSIQRSRVANTQRKLHLECSWPPGLAGLHRNLARSAHEVKQKAPRWRKPRGAQLCIAIGERLLGLGLALTFTLSLLQCIPSRLFKPLPRLGSPGDIVYLFGILLL